jgi:hypothetical protein
MLASLENLIDHDAYSCLCPHFLIFVVDRAVIWNGSLMNRLVSSVHGHF